MPILSPSLCMTEQEQPHFNTQKQSILKTNIGKKEKHYFC